MVEEIKKVAVLGASGTVGSLTGGLLAQNGLEVFFLSRRLEGSLKGLEQAQKQARSGIITDNIKCGDYDSMMDEACNDADWILECVAEDVSIKQHLYEMIDVCRKEDSIVSTVTSSLNLEELPHGRSESFQEHFLSTHFYNPPGKMLACEIAGQCKTDPSVVDFMKVYLEKHLRRIVIPVNSTVAFAGNRIAFLLFARITELASEHGVEMIDYLIGPYTGRVMAPLATIDLVGLDIHKAIIKNLQKHTNDEMHEKLTFLPYLEEMIQLGYLGRKGRDGGGFYKRLENGRYTFFDPETCGYVQAFDPHIQFVEKAKSLIHLGMYKQAFEVILNASGPEAEIVHEILATYISYAYTLVGCVTDEEYGIEGIDRVMTTGFNWEGPSMLVDMLGGNERAIELIESAKLPVPESLRADNCIKQKHFNAGRYFPAR